jgi:hypothetical protein
VAPRCSGGGGCFQLAWPRNAAAWAKDAPL